MFSQRHEVYGLQNGVHHRSIAARTEQSSVASLYLYRLPRVRIPAASAFGRLWIPNIMD